MNWSSPLSAPAAFSCALPSVSASQFPEGLWLGGKNLSFPREKACRAKSRDDTLRRLVKKKTYCVSLLYARHILCPEKGYQDPHFAFGNRGSAS